MQTSMVWNGCSYAEVQSAHLLKEAEAVFTIAIALAFPGELHGHGYGGWRLYRDALHP